MPVILAFILSLIIFPAFTFAQEPNEQGTANLQPPVPTYTIGGTEFNFQPVTCAPGETCEIKWLNEYIATVYRYGVLFAVALAVVMIMGGGLVWLMSAGRPDQISKGKEYIVGALSGLFLALFSYVILASVNNTLVNPPNLTITRPDSVELAEFDSPGWAIGGGGSSLPSGTATVGDYDFSTYAESPAHVARVNNYYNQMAGRVNNPAEAQAFIDQFSNNSQITGEMVMATAEQYNVDPAVVIAEMIQDSSLGTAGIGARTNNPGNVGNWGRINEGDNVINRRNEEQNFNEQRVVTGGETTYNQRQYDTWQDGVNAVGRWLAAHRI